MGLLIKLPMNKFLYLLVTDTVCCNVVANYGHVARQQMEGGLSPWGKLEWEQGIVYWVVAKSSSKKEIGKYQYISLDMSVWLSHDYHVLSHDTHVQVWVMEQLLVLWLPWCCLWFSWWAQWSSSLRCEHAVHNLVFVHPFLLRFSRISRSKALAEHMQTQQSMAHHYFEISFP